MKKIAILVVTILGSQGLVWSAHAASYKLLFSSNRAGSNSYDLYTMNPDGTNVIRVTNNARSDILPSWFAV